MGQYVWNAETERSTHRWNLDPKVSTYFPDLWTMTWREGLRCMCTQQPTGFGPILGILEGVPGGVDTEILMLYMVTAPSGNNSGGGLGPCARHDLTDGVSYIHFPNNNSTNGGFAYGSEGANSLIGSSFGSLGNSADSIEWTWCRYRVVDNGANVDAYVKHWPMRHAEPSAWFDSILADTNYNAYNAQVGRAGIAQKGNNTRGWLAFYSVGTHGDVAPMRESRPRLLQNGMRPGYREVARPQRAYQWRQWLREHVTLFTPGGAAGPSPISGSVSLGLDGSATLTGKGALSAGESLDLIANATPIGRAPIEGSESIDLSGSASLDGYRFAEASESIDLSASADLDGKAGAAASESIDLSASGSIAGTGALIGTADIEFTSNAILEASGQLAGQALVGLVTQGVLDGRGPLTGSALVSLTTAALLDGLGALAGTEAITFSGSAELRDQGSGAISGQATIGLDASALISAIGELAGSGELALPATAVINGVGTLQASDTLQLITTAILTAQSNLGGSASIDLSALADLDARGDLLGSASIDITAAALLGAIRQLEGSSQLDITAVGQLVDAANLIGAIGHPGLLSESIRRGIASRTARRNIKPS